MRPRLFPLPIEQCYPLNSAPYVIDFHNFAATYGASTRRKQLVASLQTLVVEMNACGVNLSFGLFGGSFIDASNECPKDLDGVVFFDVESNPDTLPASRHVASLRMRAESHSLDLRFVPLDIDPLWIVKISCFASALYARDRGTDISNNASLLVQLRDIAQSAKR